MCLENNWYTLPPSYKCTPTCTVPYHLPHAGIRNTWILNTSSRFFRINMQLSLKPNIELSLMIQLETAKGGMAGFCEALTIIKSRMWRDFVEKNVHYTVWKSHWHWSRYNEVTMYMSITHLTLKLRTFKVKVTDKGSDGKNSSRSIYVWCVKEFLTVV